MSKPCAAPANLKRKAEKKVEEEVAKEVRSDEGPLLFYRGSVYSNFHIVSPYMFHIPLVCDEHGKHRAVEVKCAETAIMLCKASLMNDDVAMEKLTQPHTAAQAKKIGRLVRNFDDVKWKAVLREVSRAIVRTKFLSDDTLKRELLSTGERRIAEASPKDAIWGIGMRISKLAEDPVNWRGQNFLGDALEFVRDEFRAAEEQRVIRPRWRCLTPRQFLNHSGPGVNDAPQ